MFAYEQEVRIVREDGRADSGEDVPGYRLDWNPGEHVEAVHVHPEADGSFFETVAATVEHFAPALKGRRFVVCHASRPAVLRSKDSSAHTARAAPGSAALAFTPSYHVSASRSSCEGPDLIREANRRDRRCRGMGVHAPLAGSA
jgi:hypothetical protein